MGRLLLLLPSLWLALVAAPAPAQAPTELWFEILTTQGQRIGQAFQQVSTGSDGTRIREESVILVREDDKPRIRISSETVTRIGPDGLVHTITETGRVGGDVTRTIAHIDGDLARVTRQSGDDRRSVTVELPEDVYFDSGAWLLENTDPAAEPRLEFSNFNLGAMAVEQVVIEPAPDATADAAGRRQLIRRAYDGDRLRTVAHLTVDSEGQIVEFVQPMFGTSIVFRRTDRETARQLQEPYQTVQGALMRAPYRIPASAMDGHIRYRFRFAPGMVFPVPETGEQRAAATDAGVTIDICADCGSGLPSDEASLEAARRPTPWLQSDHRRLREIGAPVGLLPVPDAEKMEILRRTARPYLDEIDFAGHFSALEALERGAGDCTESAVLLAALGRAAGIPTLVASGLVYSRASYHGVTNTFMPHSWTLAFVDGEWKSFDLALDAFDSTHIALTIGDGDAHSIFAAIQLAGLLEWESMTEVRPRPAE